VKDNNNLSNIKNNNTDPVEGRGWESPVATREDHAPPLEDLSPTVITGGGHEPSTIRTGEE
jgi:hypothetical protein